MSLAEALSDATSGGGGIFAKVFELQKLVGTIKKDKTNDFHKYQYASAQKVNETVGAILTELGLLAQVDTRVAHTVQNTTKAGAIEHVVIAETILTLTDVETGKSLDFRSIGGGSDAGDKGPAKAATASLKYATLAAVFGATEDDPEADTKTDIRASAPLRPVAPGSPMPGSLAAAQGPVPLGEGKFVVTTAVDKVYAGRKTARGKDGPGTVVAPNGERYDTFDTGLLELGKTTLPGGKNAGSLVNIMYTYNETYKRNTIVEHGLSLFGEVKDSSYGDPKTRDGQVATRETPVPTETAVDEEY